MIVLLQPILSGGCPDAAFMSMKKRSNIKAINHTNNGFEVQVREAAERKQQDLFQRTHEMTSILAICHETWS